MTEKEDTTMTGQPKNEGESIDSNSPYYIRASDYPKQMQVNDALNDSNYNDWEQEMQNFLFAKNKIGFVDGSIKKPEKTSQYYMAWMRCDAMIKGWLTTAMDREIRSSVKYANTAAEIWSDLKERFGKVSAPRAYELKQTLSVTQQNGTSVSAYYTKLRGVWDEIQSLLPTPRCVCSGCTCDVGKKLADLKEKERLYEFLMGLDNDFSVIRTQILAMNPTPSLGNAYHLVSEDERQRAISSEKKPTNEQVAFKTFVPGRRESNNNQRREKSVSKDPKQVDVVEHCTHCNRDGHTRNGCFKLIGYPEWWPGNRKREETKPKAALVEKDSSPIPGLSNEHYEIFVKHFAENGGLTKEDTKPAAYMTEALHEELDWHG
ncbi:putative RNA-directed DNA polymerase [Helianthus annuus]|nr:putative RNA-directed DNA polymerase [Helianthus annuus]